MGQSSIRRLWSFMKGDRVRFFLTMLCTMFGVIFNYTVPLIVGWTVDGILRRQTAGVPAPVLAVIARLGGTDYLSANLWICGLVLLCAALLRGVAAFFQGHLTARVAEGTALRIKEALYDHIQRLPYSYHVGAETGDLVQRCTTDVETTRAFIAGQLTELMRCFFILIFAVLVLGRVSVPLTLLSLMLMPVSFVYSWHFSLKIQRGFLKADEADGAMSTVLQENLTGVRVVRAFGREKFEKDKFNRSVDVLLERVNALATYSARFWSIADLTAMTQQAITLFSAMYFTVSGAITYGMFLVFNSFIGMLVWPLRQIGRVLADASKMLISMGRIGEVLDRGEEDSGENALTPPLDGDIVFDDVTFGYGGKKVLDHLSFTVRRGETVAILGATGSGKSSLVQLFQRLYDYQKGSVTIGGAELKHIDKAWLRSRVGIVLQEPFLYSRTIFENIAVTQEQASRDAVAAAARTAAFHDVVEGFEEGYETVVGERGVTLSGGQKQRLAIARTLMRDNDILIFDDSLSAVDTETDTAIRRGLKEKCRGVTTFIISHRVSTLAGADRILVLEKGRITQSGTHGELIAREGLYRRIWQIQSAARDEPENVSDTERGEGNAVTV